MLLKISDLKFNIIATLIVFSPLIVSFIRFVLIEKLTTRYRKTRMLNKFIIESRKNFDDTLFFKTIDETSLEHIIYLWGEYISEIKAGSKNNAGSGFDNYSVKLNDKIKVKIKIDRWFENNMTLPKSDKKEVVTSFIRDRLKQRPYSFEKNLPEFTFNN